ncbi:hypothetical protein [Streptomyces naphthomycinicus]|nr:hypothetical protein [Streptomyces sp. TML10]
MLGSARRLCRRHGFVPAVEQPRPSFGADPASQDRRLAPRGPDE